MFDPDYELFSCIVRQGSLSAAARTVGLSPAMVSKRLARLEARLGAHLLHRTTRRLELTPTGARFHEEIAHIVQALGEAEKRVSGHDQQPAGVLRISAPTSFGRLHVTPVLKPFLDAHPRLRVELDLADGFADLVAERIDLAIRITATIPAGLEADRLATSRRVLCAAPGYIAAHGMPKTVAQLAEHRLLAADGQLPWRLVSGRRNVVVAGESVVGTNSSEVVRELALAGVGIALRSLWDVGTDLARGRLMRILPSFEGMSDVGIFAVRPRAPFFSAAGKAFVNCLRDAYSPVPPWER